MAMGGTDVSYRKDTEARIPDSTLWGLCRWVERALPPGDFLGAVLANDLRESFARADDRNRAALFHIVRWLHNYAPGGCWGSPEAVAQWRGSDAAAVDALTGISEGDG